MKNVIVLLTLAGLADAQVPTGTIAGVVRDPSGTVVSGSRVKAVSLATGLSRNTVSSIQGDYSFAALPAGEYEVNVEAAGFQRIIRPASVEADATTTADFNLRLGDVSESITVNGATPQLRYDSYSVGGLITRNEIQELPLNGRSFLELAKLEPGVQPLSTGVNNRTFVPVLGAPGGTSGRGTRVTIDGGSIMALSAGGA
ncbi:MAG TPA: carboxypeptidase-like regulatory domain-containing protein, partial [Candidatus Solibacter sp.]|nr:carboxypeptidase-like regulatory domain-containing protein [Candidatus Solibacter sp.]